MKIITEAHIDEAIRIAEAGGRDGVGYDQGSWCGTSCCVLGWARRVAGAEEVEGGPRLGEIEDTPRARTLKRLMRCTSPDILKVMKAVRPDGVIDLRDAYLRGADLRYANLSGSVMLGASLRDAILFGANLYRADLSGADLRGARIGDATMPDGEVMPDGAVHE